MVAIKILSVGEVRTVGENNTRIATIEALQLDNKETIKISAFLGKNGDPTDLVIGTDYEADVTGKDYKGKKQYSMPIWTMKGMPKQKEEEEEAAPSQEMWAAKEKRDFKGRCLMYAIETIKQTFPEKTFTSEGDFIGMAQMIASRYLDYIYLDDEKEMSEF